MQVRALFMAVSMKEHRCVNGFLIARNAIAVEHSLFNIHLLYQTYQIYKCE